MYLQAQILISDGYVHGNCGIRSSSCAGTSHWNQSVLVRLSDLFCLCFLYHTGWNEGCFMDRCFAGEKFT